MVLHFAQQSVEFLIYPRKKICSTKGESDGGIWPARADLCVSGQIICQNIASWFHEAGY